MPSAAKGAASPWFEVRAQNLLMVKVRLLEVSLYARGPRKGDVCRDVAFHEEIPKIPSRYTWNNTPHPCHGAGKATKQSGSIHLWWKK